MVASLQLKSSTIRSQTAEPYRIRILNCKCLLSSPGQSRSPAVVLEATLPAGIFSLLSYTMGTHRLGFRESLLRVQESLAMFKQLTLCSTAAVTAFSCLWLILSKDRNRFSRSPQKDPPARRSYMGREIAQTILHRAHGSFEKTMRMRKSSIMLGNLE